MNPNVEVRAREGSEISLLTRVVFRQQYESHIRNWATLSHIQMPKFFECERHRQTRVGQVNLTNVEKRQI